MQSAAAPVVFWGPQAQRGRRNLLDVAIAATAAADEMFAEARDPGDTFQSVDPKWVNGFSFSADSCDALDPMGIQCFGSPTDKDAPENPDDVTIDPFLTFGADVCSSMDNGRDREGRARRNLLATEPWQVEREFFDGVASKTTTPQGRSPFMTDGVTAQDVTSGGAALPATRALARLEQDLLACLHGQRGIIHATTELVTLWQAGGALRLDGQTIVTIADTIVIPGAGYSGNDPDGGAPAAGVSWAYGTGLVYVRQANIFDPDVETPYARVDRDRNLTTWRVERANAVYFAPCCVKAVQASLT